MPDPISSVANLIGGTVRAIGGAKQIKEGKGIIKKIGDETVPSELIENQNLAKQQAGTGLPSEQYANAMKNIQRQQLLALSGARGRRGGLSAIAGIQQGTNDATLNLDVADADRQRENQRYSMGLNRDVGLFKNKIWERKYNYGMGLRGMGNHNLYGGIDQGLAGIAGIGASIATGGMSDVAGGVGSAAGMGSLIGGIGGMGGQSTLGTRGGWR